MNPSRPRTGPALAATVLLLLLCILPAAGHDDVVSYEQYVTLVHDQDGLGGCIGQSTNHVLEILKEMEAPYTPDPSYGFHWYVYYSATANGTDPRVPHDSKMGSYPIMATYGAAPETSYPTNFDLNGENVADTLTHPPSQAAFDEAQAYRLNNDPVHLDSPTVAQAEEWLATKGPLVCNDLYPEHTVALIGYDRTRGEFTIVDSANWGWPKHAGIKRVPYPYFASRQPNLSLESVTNRPTPLVHPYTARIRVSHEHRRSFLTVTIGAVGHDPVVVWDRNNRANFTDEGTDLAIDVPLPAYAAEHWPPSEQNPWSVQVVNHDDPSQPDTTAWLTEVTLVRRYWLAPSVISYTAYPQAHLPAMIPPGSAMYPVNLTVTSPTGGEHWTGGERRTITWDQVGLDGTDLYIRLFREENFLPYNVALSVPAEAGTWDWQVPSDIEPGDDWVVRVDSLDHPRIWDSTDSPISIHAPEADFTATPTSGLTPLPVQFTDSSTGEPVAWNWTFGDGQASTTQSPSHAYAAAGAFTVTLTVTYADGGTRTLTRPGLVTVLGSLHAGFTVGSRTGYAPYTAVFTDETTGGPTSWSWEFGDGATSTARNPVHAYADPGNYTVRLTASNPFDSSTATKTDYVRVLSLWNGLIRTEAEDYDYDHPVEGVGYHDTTPGNSGGAYRYEDVDIAPISSMLKAGCAVTNITEGEWTRYWVQSPSAVVHDYPLSLRVASWAREQSVTVTVGSATTGSVIPLPHTGSATSYGNVTGTLRLEPGMNVVRFTYHGDRMNFDHFTLGPSGAPPVPTPGFVVTVPGGIGPPTDTNGDSLHDDVNGNNRPDFADVVLFFNQMGWIAEDEPLAAFDFNGNGRLDFADVVRLFDGL